MPVQPSTRRPFGLPDSAWAITSGALAVALLVGRAVWLKYPDLANTYPFISYDGWQWLLDGLHTRGREVPTMFRNPALPLLVASLSALGALDWLPVLQTVLLGVLLLEIGLLTAPFASRGATALAVLLLACSFSLTHFFDWILADPWAVTFLVAGVRQLSLVHQRPSRIPAALVLLGASFQFQYAAGFVVPAAGLWLLLVARPLWPDRAAGRRLVLLGVLLALLLTAPVFVWKLATFGDPLYSRVQQFGLVVPHLSGLGFYALNLAAFLGWPAALLTLAGVVRLRQPPPGLVLVLACALSELVFWVLLYQWQDPRFLLYVVPLLGPFLARGLDAFDIPARLGALSSRPGRAVVPAVALLFAALLAATPRSTPFTANQLPLWPGRTLEAGTVSNPAFPDNEGITLRGALLQVVEVRAPFDYLRGRWHALRRRGVDPARIQEASELRELRRFVDDHWPPRARLGLCGSLSSDYETRQRLQLSLERTLAPCGEPAAARLSDASSVRGLAPAIFRGARYQLSAP